VATGGVAGQVLIKQSGVDYATAWGNVTGGLSYQGSWNALSNSPALSSSVGTNGFYYIVSTAGTTNLNGITDWQIGDWAIFNGTVWQKIDQTNTVTSVNGQVGAVSLAYADLAGTVPTWNQNTTGTAANVTGVVATINGGTGQSSYAVGDILYASTTTALSKLSDVATGNALISGGVGVAPSYGKIGLTTHVSGTLAIGNGGTGQTTASAAFNALSPITTTGDLIIGNGAGSATRLPIGTSGYLLTSNGTTAAWTAAPASMVYPGAGIPNSTGSAWGTSYSTTGSGTVVALATNAALTTPAITGGSVDNATIGSTTRNTIAGTTELIGPAASANFTRFPGALAVVSNTSSGIQQNESMNVGLLAEGVSSNTTWASGLYGAGYTNTVGNGRGTGVTGEGHVSAATDTGVAVGVRGYANDTHTGNYNIGLYGDASNGDSGLTYGGNVALFLANGNIVTSSASAKSWYLGGNLVFDGQGSAKTITASNGATITATNIAGGAASQIPYQTGAGATSFIANGTAGQVLTSAGSSAPVWGGISGGTF
jgi:hypothetical protein